jgi:hypothetical protein
MIFQALARIKHPHFTISHYVFWAGANEISLGMSTANRFQYNYNQPDLEGNEGMVARLQSQLIVQKPSELTVS